MQVHIADHRLSVRQADLPMLQSAKDDRMQEPRLRVRRRIVSWDEDAALWSACWSASKQGAGVPGRGEAQGLTGPELSASVDVVVDHVPNHRVPTGDRVVGQE